MQLLSSRNLFFSSHDFSEVELSVVMYLRHRDKAELRLTSDTTKQKAAASRKNKLAKKLLIFFITFATNATQFDAEETLNKMLGKIIAQSLKGIQKQKLSSGN